MTGTGELRRGSVMVNVAAVDRRAQAWLTLSAQEHARMGRLHRAEDRAAYAAAHGMLRELVERASGVAAGAAELVYEASGRPQLAAPLQHLSVSLSHARAAVAVAIGWGVEVGIDIECVSGMAPDPGVMDLALTQAERASLACGSASGLERRFLRLWTAKEAVLKAQGLGLPGGLQSICLARGAQQPSLSPALGAPGDWSIETHDTTDCVWSLAVRVEPPGSKKP